jgi:hypothetical protein
MQQPEMNGLGQHQEEGIVQVEVPVQLWYCTAGEQGIQRAELEPWIMLNVLFGFRGCQKMQSKEINRLKSQKFGKRFQRRDLPNWRNQTIC